MVFFLYLLTVFIGYLGEHWRIRNWLGWTRVSQLDVDIELPETDNPLNSQMMQSLRDQFDVTEESDDFGIEMYLNVKRYVENLIA